MPQKGGVTYLAQHERSNQNNHGVIEYDPADLF